jgi:hypothetical protein
LCKINHLQQVIEGKITGRYKLQEDEEGNLGSYWMILTKGKDRNFGFLYG